MRRGRMTSAASPLTIGIVLTVSQPNSTMDRRDFLLSLGSAAGTTERLAPEGAAIVFPATFQGNAPFRHYCEELLRQSALLSGKAYRFESVSNPVGQGRAIRMMSAGEGPFNVLWSMTSEVREQQLLPLRIPLDRGLMGWRLLLVRKDDQARFAALRSLEDLRGIPIGQMHDWPDTQILRANGLTVGTSSVFASLFTMLLRGRIDAIALSALEVEQELARSGHAAQLAIAPGWMLRYPAAYYYFVSPREPQLAEDLRRGLERLVSEGRLQALFQQHVRPQLERLGLRDRRMLALLNPLLPAATPLRRAELWEEPGRLGH